MGSPAESDVVVESTANDSVDIVPSVGVAVAISATVDQVTIETTAESVV